MESKAVDARHSALRVGLPVVAFQCLAMALLVVAALLGSRPYGALVAQTVVVVLLQGVFLVFWPLRATAVDRVLGAFAGVASTVVAWLCVLSDAGDRPLRYPAVTTYGGGLTRYGSWAMAVVVLMVAAVVVAFARQMLREERAHLVRSLSHAILSAVICVGAAGWLFLPALVDLAKRSGYGAWLIPVAVVVVLVVQVVLAMAWWADADPDPSARKPWMGTAAMPVAIMGYLIFAAVFLIPLL